MYEQIFYDKRATKVDVFHSIMSSADGLKRVTSPITAALNMEERLMAFKTKSASVKLGDAMEDWVNQYVQDHGYELLVRRVNGDIGDADFDFVYTKGNEIWISEIKIKDDHDSTKKVANCDSYMKKVKFIEDNYPSYTIHSCLWFIDPGFFKNRNYYLSRLAEDEVVYGREFDEFIGLPGLFDEMLSSLKKSKQMPAKDEDHNIDVDFSLYSVGKWYSFISCGNDELINYFYPEGLPYKQLVEYAQTKRQTASTIEFINQCKEKYNE